MSSNVFSSGFMVPLITPLTKDEREDVYYKLEKSDLHINYEGTILYSDETHDFDGGYGIMFEGVHNNDNFLYSLKDSGLDLPINLAMMKYYTRLWYNGSDSDMSMMTIQRFKEENNYA